MKFYLASFVLCTAVLNVSNASSITNLTVCFVFHALSLPQHDSNFRFEKLNEQIEQCFNDTIAKLDKMNELITKSLIKSKPSLADQIMKYGTFLLGIMTLLWKR